MIGSVLIIDDNDADQYLLRRSLLRAGLTETVFQALDGKKAFDLLADLESQALDRADYSPPEILFLDINMPGMNAFDFLDDFQRIRDSDVRYHRCSVLIFSSSDRSDDQVRSLDYDFVKAYLVKPVTTQRLRAIVAELETGGSC